jgi:ribosomal protein S18 acetylase RimI-like enzyme
MPGLTDRTRIRALLETDRRWAVYALGDLRPGYFEDSTWLIPADGSPAIALLYHAFSTPVLLTVGDAAHLRSLLGEIEEALGDTREMYLSVRPDVKQLLAERYEIRFAKRMHRMVLQPELFRPAAGQAVVRLGPADLDAVKTLYADGGPTGESPDFFAPPMLRDGVYFGVREGEDLVTAAGTHILAPEEGVCGIGNIYTRRDRRRRGLAACVTSAVVAEALEMKLPTLALNVWENNPTARRVYERLGFCHYCDFYEAVAVLPLAA